MPILSQLFPILAPKFHFAFISQTTHTYITQTHLKKDLAVYLKYITAAVYFIYPTPHTERNSVSCVSINAYATLMIVLVDVDIDMLAAIYDVDDDDEFLVLCILLLPLLLSLHKSIEILVLDLHAPLPSVYMHTSLQSSNEMMAYTKCTHLTYISTYLNLSASIFHRHCSLCLGLTSTICSDCCDRSYTS